MLFDFPKFETILTLKNIDNLKLQILLAIFQMFNMEKCIDFRQKKKNRGT